MTWGFLLDVLWNWLMEALKPYASIPASTFLTIAVAGMLASINAVASRLLVDMDKVRSATKQFSAWRREFSEARKQNNKQLVAKLMKKQQAVMQLQGRASFERMKVSFLFLIPFWILWMVLRGFYGDTIVALSPFALPMVGTQLTFFPWYLVASFAVSLPVTRLMGVNPED